MFWKNTGLWVLLVIICATFKPAWALRCYNCTGFKSKFCGSNSNEHHVAQTNCEEGKEVASNIKPKFACMVLHETDTISGRSTVIRRCVMKHKMNDGCDYIINTSKLISRSIETNCSECGTDLCNSASPVYKPAVLILILIALNLTK
ncbi:lymphocyte antigen 6D [Dendroctonus ponderosae]|uniref:Protein sleepless n=1 Tax=Dendroctonus ponderosae TaxID=77166 RepID=A0AAR5QJP1_DENPD|nr:lymphocyte antigen 6D [Dendroctonus ponderosae]KAH1011635.1 hypothetical protein HUJ04_000963 [Dendroctonus ponderosae]KAH1018430.1 hypothetical protein HUJ05_006206 [Dendroctonus ponderosae]